LGVSHLPADYAGDAITDIPVVTPLHCAPCVIVTAYFQQAWLSSQCSH